MNEQPTTPFNWGAFILAFMASLLGGAVLNVGAGLLALAVENQPGGALLGAAPGIILIAISRALKRSGSAQGMLAAGCIVALIGGLCGYSLGAGLNMH